MSVVRDPAGLTTIPREGCLHLLATQQVGRLGFLSGGRPEVEPVNFALDGDAIVFATGAGAKLWAVSRSPVAFEVDGLDPANRSGWSVIVHGLAQEITASDAPSLLARLRAIHLAPWVGERPNLVRIPMTEISGRRVGPLASVSRA